MTTVSTNRISVSLDELSMAEVQSAFLTIHKHLPFLLRLNPQERQTIPRVNVANKQFISDALTVMHNHQELFPGYLDAEVFSREMELYTQLEVLMAQARELFEKLLDTKLLAGSEAYLSAMSVYKLVTAAAHAGIPGADSICEQLSERYATYGPTTVNLPPISKR